MSDPSTPLRYAQDDKRGRDYLIDSLKTIDKTLVETMMHHACGYLFAKSIEAVFHWNNSKDGKISIYFHIGDVAAQKVNAELDRKTKRKIEDSQQIGYTLFKIHQKFVMEHFNDLNFNMDEEIKSIFTTIISIGINYAMENKL